MAGKKVSIVIPSWNRKDDLKRSLDSIKTQDYDNIEVIVVDNGSKDGSVDMVEKDYKGVKLIKNGRNMGVSVAKNQGILASTGEFIHFCDSDIEMFNKGMVSAMVKILEENPKIGALGGEAYIQSDGKVVSKKKDITINCETSTVVMPDNNYKLEKCGYIATCNCMMPRNLVYMCKGFDTEVMYGGEDKEFGLKLKKMGYSSVVDSRCLLYHHISQSTQHRNFYPLNKNRIRIVVKNYNPLYVMALPLLDVISGLNPKKYKDIKSGSVDVKKYLKAEEREKKQSFVSKVVKIGGEYGWSLVKSYAWNTWHLPHTVAVRVRDVDYLELTKNGVR